MDSFSGKIQPAVNGAEAVYIFRALTNQMSLTPDKEANLPAVANDKTLHGLLFQKKPGEVTRLGSKIDSAALLRNVQGFRIKLKI